VNPLKSPSPTAPPAPHKGSWGTSTAWVEWAGGSIPSKGAKSSNQDQSWKEIREVLGRYYSLEKGWGQRNMSSCMSRRDLGTRLPRGLQRRGGTWGISSGRDDRKSVGQGFWALTSGCQALKIRDGPQNPGWPDASLHCSSGSRT
jgi:hypothetical protein